MNTAMTHRGPDDEGYFVHGEIKMGMRRLSIVDIESGRQPISNEDETVWTVFNGEIYDHKEIRNSLIDKGHRFHTHHSDTEVIVHLYEEYGEDWPNHVNGMFGAAIWDQTKKRLTLYRDRIGKKPLYYAVKGSRIIFGSEIKSILQHPDVSKEFNYRALYHYFGFKNISAPHSAYKEISQLLPGHYLVWENGHIKTQPYWSLDFSSPIEDITEDEAATHLRTLYEDAVRIRMRGDAPYGAYLSGGIDSSSVASLMSRFQSHPIKTFCLGYTDDPEGQFVGKNNDIQYARFMSERIGSKHFEYIISAGDFAEMMPQVLKAFDEPFSGTISTFFLTILMRQHVKVAISGDGADELFGSYLTHRLANPIQSYMALVRSGKKAFGDLSSEEKAALSPFNEPETFAFMSSIASDDILEWRSRLQVFPDEERHSILSGEFLESSGLPDRNEPYSMLGEKITATGILNKSLEIDQKELLANQVLPFVDRLSMAHSVEVRCPFLDYRVIEFANRLPGWMKIRLAENKIVHRRALEGILPEEIINRPKEGFVQPIYSWMYEELKGWTLEKLSDLPSAIFNRENLKTYIERFEKGDQSLNARIWNLVCFSIWYQNATA